MPEFVYESPIGPLIISVYERRVVALKWKSLAMPEEKVEEYLADSYADEITSKLDSYFSGKTDATGIEVQMHGTAFQKKVWKSLIGIPLGETRTYSDVASTIGNPRAYRAVGSACARNRIPVIIPCHRVVGKDDVLGWSGNPGAKEWLLEHEKKNSVIGI
ncbi:MAG: methylated-DNA--[protein]-cysteine S-methyltransferase [Candidatus Thermoplasmatota archaeon]|nr:methylated-DNA--[protein]-cysteine S-methyltransferase [Candidatus Thermoplasmatota archaeon]